MTFPDGFLHGVVIDNTVGEVSDPHRLRGILCYYLQTGGTMGVAFLKLRPQPVSER